MELTTLLPIALIYKNQEEFNKTIAILLTTLNRYKPISENPFAQFLKLAINKTHLYMTDMSELFNLEVEIEDKQGHRVKVTNDKEIYPIISNLINEDNVLHINFVQNDEVIDSLVIGMK